MSGAVTGSFRHCSLARGSRWAFCWCWQMLASATLDLAVTSGFMAVGRRVRVRCCRPLPAPRSPRPVWYSRSRWRRSPTLQGSSRRASSDLYARPRQSGDARRVHWHVSLLPRRVADHPQRGGNQRGYRLSNSRRLRSPSCHVRRPGARDHVNGGPDLICPPRDQRHPHQ